MHRLPKGRPDLIHAVRPAYFNPTLLALSHWLFNFVFAVSTDCEGVCGYLQWHLDLCESKYEGQRHGCSRIWRRHGGLTQKSFPGRL